MVLRWGGRTSGAHGPRRDVSVEDAVAHGLTVAHVGVLACPGRQERTSWAFTRCGLSRSAGSARRPPPWGVKQGRLRAVVDEPRGVKSLQAGGIHAVHEPARRVSQSCAPRRVARVVQRLTVRQEARAPRDVC